MKKAVLLLLLIFLLASFLRLKNLAVNPPGFYTDEASAGFNAYKILTTARDEHGNFMPFFFEAQQDYKNIFEVYPIVPFIALFGVSEFSVRLAQAFFGILNILLIFFLAKVLWNDAVGLMSAFILAISPWQIHLSRSMIGSHNAFLFFVLAGTLFLVLARKNSWRSSYLTASSVLFGISFYTYFATRIFTPFFLAGILFFWRADFLKLVRKDTKKTLLAIALFVLIVIPFALHLLSGKGFSRYREVPFTHRQNLIVSSAKLYLLHFEPKLVFLRGDSDYPGQQIIRHSVTGIGLFYKWQTPFFILGILFLIFAQKDHRDARVVVFLMLALYPLGTVVSDAVTPYATRSVIGVIPYALLIAFGIYRSFLSVSGMGLKLAFVLAIGFVSIFYLDRYLDLYGAYANRAYGYNGFQYGARDIVRYFMADHEHTVKIMDSGFDGKQAFLDFYSLGKCEGCYPSDPNPNDRETKKLLAVSVSDLRSFNERYSGTIVHKIYYPDDREAFYIFEATSLPNSL